MPPLPALRFSPGRERMTENSHKRGQSFESGLTLKAKDDDLVLFNEVQNQERDNFLLHTTDDFEDSLSKLKDFSDFGINNPSRGKSSDLLNVEDEKNDYDWLLTPPETPLFPTLDDDDPQPVNPAPGGRQRSQPIPISRSLTDKNYQTTRTSYSPQRLSPSPRSIGASTQMKGRSSSAPQSSPPVIRSTTPTRRSCTPPNKSSSTPIPRSSTPTLRRESTSSSFQASNYGGRRPSPAKASRGSSASPKSQGWQMILPGFNSEAPPNLRTSLSDRPVSHVRGSSPASRNGRELSMKLAGKMMSPTSSRSISSSHNQERDHFSSCSKGSMSYSGDDDEESLHSITVGISRSVPPRKDGFLTNNKAMPFSRKPSRTVPKRSFDSAPRLMDQRKTPQSMFRPLLSSVPASTFRPIFSRNSSLTTSSNTSSEQGVVSVALDAGGSEHEHVLPPGWERVEDFDSYEDVFLFDKIDEIIRVTNDEAFSGPHRSRDENLSENLRKKFNSKYFQNPMTSSNIASELAQCADNQCDIDGYPITAVCSKCGKEFNIEDTIGNKKLCKECGETRFCTAERALTSLPFSVNEVPSQMDTMLEALSKGKLNTGVPELHKDDNGKVKLGQHEINIERGADFIQNILSLQLLDQNESQTSDQHLNIKKNINVTQDCRGSTCQSSNPDVIPSLKVGVPESAGISVLLQQGSASAKWPILQGKALSATNILCSEPSYSRNNVNALRRSFGLDNCSTTSTSIDLGLLRQTETYVQYQLSRKSDALGIERDIESYAQTMSSDYDASTNCCESRHLRNKFDEKISSSTECLGYDSSREMILVTEDYTSSLDQSNSPSSRPKISEDYRSVLADNCRTVSSPESQNLNHQGSYDIPYSSAADIMCAEECTLSINTDKDPQNNGINAQIIEKTSDISVLSEMDEDHITVNHTSANVFLDEATNSCSIGTIESHDGCVELEDGQTDCMPFHKTPSPEHLNELTVPQISENDTSLCSSESVAAVLENGESAIMVEGPRGHQSRNLTLEEATDTILFCSSIIHDLAYRASTIAMEKDQGTLLEDFPPPTVKIMEKPIPGLREESGNLSKKLTLRSQKFKLKKTEAQTKSPLRELKNENDVNIEEFRASKVEIPRQVDSAKPPKLESKCNCSIM
ncbi:hypothetical protein KFK09_027053 [Dendrobium nobile]|uniref:Uncharacterized protein n=1 Tax=Dendrobium nobile TaxID=94219 RepID=A0A8T3A8L2_DENNO|nr:hypothetical protein KFK09_027053 [Dendrobium nobile]